MKASQSEMSRCSPLEGRGAEMGICATFCGQVGSGCAWERRVGKKSVLKEKFAKEGGG